jgi:pimeloyl-ACP methyl ester carboxylesterase
MIYDSSENGNQFQLLAWIKKYKEGKWTIYSGVLQFFNMFSAAQWANNILRPTCSPLFAESMSILEPKIVYRNLDVPLLILDPVSEGDFMPFEEENKALQKQHPDFIVHKIYKDTGHNIHYERSKQFIEDLTEFLKKLKR